ncbi:uncharacterized protein BT62DRAFT_938978 [Guyanagaster necrorhizus]|uniref:CBD9-like protein n=1 Tax=Guyanagaster necrorhizus TaxID=856835 RepID=A0A9P8AL89_9AGAR|nr:uncharacterized protein BT62DRAFT_938978 [Guyanagaster necrorhizus MCA 3950]KAG7439474.1 hypothetical protein BT62DRAFT_938978 [Guyanagaster necrorhizus MCA 3950]
MYLPRVTPLLTLCGLVVAVQSSNSSSVTGDSRCGQYMCVKATVNETTVQYALSSTGSRTAGWMGIGFGSQMDNTQMVIMWSNSDGSITLSQRLGDGHNLPRVDSSPDRVATLVEAESSTLTSNTTFTFTVDTTNATTQRIIFGFGSTNPGSSSVDADLAEHISYGSFDLNLNGNITSRDPLESYERMLIAHAILCILGFLLFLPFGSLLARYLRTFTPKWYTGHWISQFALAGPLITVGFALGVQGVSLQHVPHLDDDHQKWGAGIFVLYLAQCAIGAFIHWVKPKKRLGRPPQNYFHAVLGLIVIGLSFYQVRTGYVSEWPNTTGRGTVANGANIVWYIWVVLLPVLYLAGLAFLPKQYRQEANARKERINSDENLMNLVPQHYHD